MENVVRIEMKPEPNKLQCTKCAATIDAPCDCGVDYKLLRPREKAKIGIEQHPDESSRAIAIRSGVSEYVVRQTRNELQLKNAVEPEKRTGLDGKVRKMPEVKWPPERNARLRELFAQGMTGAEVAQELNTTIGAVTGQKAKLEELSPNFAARRIPAEMPENILQLAINHHIAPAKFHMYEMESLSLYADQMHYDTRHTIAEEVKVVLDLCRTILKRLVGNEPIRAPECGTTIRVHKES